MFDNKKYLAKRMCDKKKKRQKYEINEKAKVKKEP